MGANSMADNKKNYLLFKISLEKGYEALRYLHIIPPSRRMMDTYIKMLRKHFKEEEHYFYFINHCPLSEQELFKYGNVQEMSGNGKIEKMKHLYRALKEADVVLWHGLIYPGRFMLFLAANPAFLRKSVWVMWGIDLYNWKREGNSLRNKVINYLNFYCRCHMKAAVALLPTDKEYFQEQFSNKIPCYVTPYPISEESFRSMEHYRNSKPRKNGKVFIQVAHNAHTFNNHIEILESLLPFKDENIKLFLPLSYGNDWHTSSASYVRGISKFLADNFPHKACNIYKLMPQVEYTEFLWNMDIAIFNAKRQNALGNVLKLLYMGNKVFMTSDGPLYAFFQEKGIPICDTKKISSMTYEEFIAPVDNSPAIQWIWDTYHPENSYKSWKLIFEKCGNCELEEKEAENIYGDILRPDSQLEVLQKPNFFSVDRYLKWPKALHIQDVKDVYIIGAGLKGLTALQWLIDSNRKKYRWFFQGFLDNTLDTFEDNALGDYDIVGNWEQGMPSDSAVYICAIETAEEKKKFLESWKENLDKVITFTHPLAAANYPALIGTGCLLGPGSNIDIAAHLGDLVYIDGAHIGCRAHIGNYCLIGRGCEIGCNAIVGEGTVIDPDLSIPPNTRIPDGIHITPENLQEYVGSCSC